MKRHHQAAIAATTLALGAAVVIAVGSTGVGAENTVNTPHQVTFTLPDMVPMTPDPPTSVSPIDPDTTTPDATPAETTPDAVVEGFGSAFTAPGSAKQWLAGVTHCTADPARICVEDGLRERMSHIDPSSRPTGTYTGWTAVTQPDDADLFTADITYSAPSWRLRVTLWPAGEGWRVVSYDRAPTTP